MPLVTVQTRSLEVRGSASLFTAFMEGPTDIAFSASHGIKMGECVWKNTCLTHKNENNKVLLQNNIKCTSKQLNV